MKFELNQNANEQVSTCKGLLSIEYSILCNSVQQLQGNYFQKLEVNVKPSTRTHVRTHRWRNQKDDASSPIYRMGRGIKTHRFIILLKTQ